MYATIIVSYLYSPIRHVLHMLVLFQSERSNAICQHPEVMDLALEDTEDLEVAELAS